MLAPRAVVWVGLTVLMLTAGAPAFGPRVTGMLSSKRAAHDTPAALAYPGSPMAWVFVRAEGAGTPGTQPVSGAAGWDTWLDRSDWPVAEPAPPDRLTVNDRHSSLHWFCRLTV